MASHNTPMHPDIEAYLETKIGLCREFWWDHLEKMVGQHQQSVHQAKTALELAVAGLQASHDEVYDDMVRIEGKEKARIITREFMKARFHDVRGLMIQINEVTKSNQYLSPLASPTGDRNKELDRRSITLRQSLPPVGISIELPGHPQNTSETEARPILSTMPGDPGPSRSPYDMPPSPPPPPSTVTYTNLLQQTAKRALNQTETDTDSNERDKSRAPAFKKAKKSTGPLPVPDAQHQVKRTIRQYEVEGQDYIFKYPKFGPNWFILRCNLGEQEGVNVPFQFRQHPLENRLAQEHFSTKRGCHDHKQYSNDDIMREFGHRVIPDGSKDELTDEIVMRLNSKAAENAKERMKGKGIAKRGKQNPQKQASAKKGIVQQPEFGRARRTTINIDSEDETYEEEETPLQPQFSN